MANTVNITYPVNGSRLFVAHIQILGDGSGEETAAEIIDVADLTGTPSFFKIRSIQWSLGGFAAYLLWDASTDDPAFGLSAGEDTQDFACKGAPLINPKSSGATGKMNLTTVGLGAGDAGTIIITGYH
jgi:hypothetical protein